MGNLSLISALAAIMASYLGSGINYMPSAFNNTGWFYSFLMLFFVSCLSSVIVYFLLRTFTRKSNQNATKDVTYSMLGLSISKKMMVVMDISNIFSQLLTMMAYQKHMVQSTILFIDNFKHSFYSQTIQYLVFIGFLIPLMIFSTIRKFSELKIFSYISVCSAILSPIVLIFLNFTCSDYMTSHYQNDEITYDYVFSGGIILFAMAGMTSIIEIYKELLYQTRKNQYIICGASSFFAFVVYGLVGSMGYRIFGNTIEKKEIIEIYLDNRSDFNKYLITNNNIWSFYIAKIQGIFGILALFCSFPLQVPSIYVSLKTMVDIEIVKTKNFTRYLVILMVSLITAFNFIPNVPINCIFEMAGYTFFNWSNFLFPSLLYFYRKQNVPFFEKIICMIIIFASIVLSVIGPYYTFKNMNLQFPVNERNGTIQENINLFNKTNLI